MYKVTREFLKKESRKRILAEKEIQENFYRVSIEHGLNEDAEINAKNLFLIEWYLENKFKEFEPNQNNYTPTELEGVFINDGVKDLKHCTECKNALNVDLPGVLMSEKIQGKRSKFLTWDCLKCNTKLISLQL